MALKLTDILLCLFHTFDSECLAYQFFWLAHDSVCYCCGDFVRLNRIPLVLRNRQIREFLLSCNDIDPVIK